MFVSVCVCMCVHMYVYVSICNYVYIRMYMYVYGCVYMFMNVLPHRSRDIALGVFVMLDEAKISALGGKKVNTNFLGKLDSVVENRFQTCFWFYWLS